MTNQEKWQNIYDLTGPKLFSLIIQAAGPGETLHVPKNVESARRKARNRAIRLEFYSPEFKGMTNKQIYQVLAERYGLSPDRIRKIINTSGSR